MPTALRRNRDFVLLLSGHAASTAGDQVSALALPLLVLALTESPTQAGAVAACQALPYLLLSLPAGALIDRWDRKAVMMLAEGVRGLVVLSVPVAYALGALGIAQLYGVALVSGSAFVFFNLAQLASFQAIVPRSQLARAVSAHEAVESGAELLGPGLGGAIVGLGRNAVGGAATAYLVDAISFAASVVTLGAIRRPLRVPRDPGVVSDVRRELMEGLLFLWRHRALRSIAAIAVALNLLFAPSSLALIVLARDGLGAEPAAIGLIFSIGAAGGVLGALLAPASRRASLRGA